MKKSDFSYDLPEHLIAQYPLAERSASRLLYLNRANGQLSDFQFSDLLSLLKPNDLLVFNDTKVIPARLFGKKITGGKVEILIERILDNQQAIAHVKASKSAKAGTLILLEQGVKCQIVERVDDLFKIQFISDTHQNILDILDHLGHMPLPPYIERNDERSDLDRYQTLFAKSPGAVAAPTAGLHFDDVLLNKIKQLGIASAYVTLHVGSGTFQPVRVENLNEHRMHQEFFSVPIETERAVSRTRQCGGRVIAVGTTAVRALESASQQGYLQVSSGETRLFITPGYCFKSVDALITNFHLSESTLLMLVCAFSSHHNTMSAYQYAMTQGYRFFSYGDAMFIS